MPLRQQRTPSRTRLDPGQGPLPVLYRPALLTWDDATHVTLIFDLPTRLEGIPLVTQVGSPSPIAAVQNNEFSITLEYADPIDPGTIVTLPDWSPALRGFNGEWVTGGPYRLGASPESSQIPLLYIIGASTIEDAEVTFQFSGPFDVLTFPNISNNGEGPPISGVAAGPSTWILTYAGSIAVGSQWLVSEWDPANATTDGKWLAPGTGGMVPG